MFNTPTLVSNRSCIKRISKPETAGNYSLNDAGKLGKSLNSFKTSHRIINRAADNFNLLSLLNLQINLAQSFNKYYAHTRILMKAQNATAV